MTRLPFPTADQLDEEQQAVWDAVTNGRRGDPSRFVGPNGGMIGPFNAAVVAPRTGRAVVALGEALRFDSRIDRRLLELAVCTVGAHWRSNFEWWAHRSLAEAAGVSDDVLDALQRGDEPSFAADDERAVHRLTRSLLTTGRVDPDTYTAAHAHLDDEGMVELVQLVGYYSLVSFTLNTFEVELPPGNEPAWPYRWD